MSKQQINEAVLLKTSLATDVQSVGGYITVAGLTPTWKKTLSSIKQIKSKTEVSQVITVGGVDTTWVPTGNTTYGIVIGDPRRALSSSEANPKVYSYITTASLALEGTTAALRREFINGKIVTAINKDLSDFVTAASLLLGNGFTITDNAGYNPNLRDNANILFAQGQSGKMGKSTVQIWSALSGPGYASTNIATTTAAVYAFGQGADLLNGKPVMDFMYGNLIQGTLIAPPLTTAGLGAVSGQAYDAFVINSFNTVAVHSQEQGQQALKAKIQTIWVDNGTGTSTANLAGFTAVERSILREAFLVYATDASAIFDFFDNAQVSGVTVNGVIATGADNVAVPFNTGTATWYCNLIGSSTIVSPLVTTAGLPLFLTAADEKGTEISAPILTQSPKEVVVGKSEYSFYARVTATNYAHLEEFAFGLRKKAAYAVNTVAYDAASTDFVSLGLVSEAVSGLINIQTSKAAAGVVSTSTTTTWSSGAHDMLITVDINGAVRFYIDSVDVTAKQTTAYTFVVGTHIIPFVDAVSDANVDAAPFVVQIAALPTISWRA